MGSSGKLTLTGTRIEATGGAGYGRGLGALLRNVATLANPRSEPRELERAHEYLARERRGISGPSGAAGGWLLTGDVEAAVMRSVAESSIVRRGATIVRMDAPKVRVPALRPVVPSAGAAPHFGGFSPVWHDPMATVPLNQDEPSFSAIELRGWGLSGSFGVPMSLLRGVEDFDAIATTILAGAVGALEEAAFLRGGGDGHAQPLGIVRSGALVQTSARASGSAIGKADVHALWSKLLPSSKPRATWVASPGAEQAALADVGAATTPAPEGSGAAYAYLGRPVRATEHLPALNTAGDMLLIDPRYYLIGDGGTEIAASAHFDFRNGVVWYRVTHTVAGATWVNEAITLADGTVTVSPFAALAPSA